VDVVVRVDDAGVGADDECAAVLDVGAELRVVVEEVQVRREDVLVAAQVPCGIGQAKVFSNVQASM
jgi:hypothetical protein